MDLTKKRYHKMGQITGFTILWAVTRLNGLPAGSFALYFGQTKFNTSIKGIAGLLLLASLQFDGNLYFNTVYQAVNGTAVQ